MSAPAERRALTFRHAPPSRRSLHSYVRDRLDAEPDGRLPEGGYEPPDDAVPPRTPPPEGATLRYHEAFTAVQEAVGPLLAPPGTGHVAAARAIRRRLDRLPVTSRMMVSAVAELPLPDEPAARALGRHLVRTGHDLTSVRVGLALLARLGEPADVPYVRDLGLLRGLTRPAVLALERLDPRAAALLRLACRTQGPVTAELVAALGSGDARAAAAAVIAEPLGLTDAGPGRARLIAEAADLAGLLRRDRTDPRLLLQAGRLLVRMADPRADRSEILHHRDAAEVYEAVVRRSCGLPPTVERAAVLLSLALDLDSGPSHLLPWREGQREQLLDALGALLTSPGWAALPDRADAAAPPGARHRAAWLRDATGRLFAARPAPPRLRIEVVAADPVERRPVETRFLIDGRPLVPEAFGRGPGHAPEHLLDSGDLVATGEPREVRLAEAWCTEGCCGALHVTVVREGDEVVWRDWRRPDRLPGGAVPPPLPAYRFDAAAYDAELARAVREDGWSWPARETARLLAAGLRRDPELPARWGARLLRVGLDTRDPYTTALWFRSAPGSPAGAADGRDEPPPFVWRLPDDGTDPRERAAAALRRLAEQDPREYAERRGGGH